MKYLFIIKSIMSAWASVYKRYTAIILLSLVLSVLALFVIATNVAAEHMPDKQREDWYNSNYLILPEYDEEFRNTYGIDRLPCTHQILDKYLKADLPPTVQPYGELDWAGNVSMLYTYKNGVRVFPCDVFQGVLVFDSTQSKYAEIVRYDCLDYFLKSGRNYSDEELKSHKPVLVASESTGLKVGDVIKSAGYDIEVIGIISGEYSLVPFWLADECMQHFDGYLSRQFDDAENNITYQIPSYDVCATFSSLTFEHPLSAAQEARLRKSLGLKKNELFTSYGDILDADRSETVLISAAEGSVFALFCVINIVFSVWCLCNKNLPTVKNFRIYGAGSKQVALITLSLVLILTVIAGTICQLLAPLLMIPLAKINSGYVWREMNLLTAVGVMLIFSIIAAIPAMITAIKIGKKQ